MAGCTGSRVCGFFPGLCLDRDHAAAGGGSDLYHPVTAGGGLLFAAGKLAQEKRYGYPKNLAGTADQRPPLRVFTKNWQRSTSGSRAHWLFITM